MSALPPEPGEAAGRWRPIHATGLERRHDVQISDGWMTWWVSRASWERRGLRTRVDDQDDETAEVVRLLPVAAVGARSLQEAVGRAVRPARLPHRERVAAMATGVSR